VQRVLEIKQLYYFKIVAEHLNFTKAAKSLNMSQPPLSYQIKKLEEYLGVDLFNRTNKYITLTEAGKYFYDISQSTLSNLENQIDIVKQIGKGELYNLKIGFGGSVVHDLLPEIIHYVKFKYPKLELTVQQYTTAQQVLALKNGEIDIGILVPPLNDLSINTLSIRQEEFIVCLHKNHPFANKTEPLSVSSFKNECIITPPNEAGSSYFDGIISLCKLGGFSPDITLSAQEQHTMVSFVASKLGISFVPYSTSRIINKNVVYKKLLEKVYKETALAWNSTNHNPAVHLFISIIKEIIT